MESAQQPNISQIFSVSNPDDFKGVALQIFRYQAVNNPIYNKFIRYLNLNINKVQNLEQIPFLPVEFFKYYTVTSAKPPYDTVFKSSGTTGQVRSKHYIKSLQLYEMAFSKSFQYFYGDIENYVILALLPSYVAQGNSSLVYMVQKFIDKSQYKTSGFYLQNDDKLAHVLQLLERKKQKTILIGVSYALLDFIEKHKFHLTHTIIMETGGMKGRRKEMLREELHNHLKQGFGVNTIHSEYGMSELLSQSYSYGNGIFQTPPWQKILIRDTEDPFTYLPQAKTGGVNIIDLANLYSCSFIATQDLGKKLSKNTFTISGRFDNSDIRGCNLLIL